MPPLKPAQVLARLRWRYATKRFARRRIARGTWAGLEQAVLLAPSSGNLCPYGVIVVDDPAVRARLLGASCGQPQVADADRLVVFAIKTDFGAPEVEAMVARTAAVRGLPLAALAGLRNRALGGIVRGLDDDARRAWAAHQAYLALGTLLTAAALLGIDACPMEGFERCQYDDILGLREHGLGAVVVAALGHRHPDDKHAAYPKVRFPPARVIRHV